MARTITDEEIKLSIIINGNPAQKQLLDLEKATRRLTEENKSLILEKKRLEAQGLKESAQYKEITAKIKSNNLALSENKNAMKELQNQIGVTGLTMAQLTQKATLLKMTLRNLVPGSADYVRYQQELKQVNTRIGELNGRAATAGLSIGKIADGFNRYAALSASVIGFFAGMVVSVQKIIDLNGKLSDTQADVMKTTGMTKKEVDELTKSFGVLETRTSRIDLLKIAEQGGRIGIAKEEIQDFVKTMNMANVALGDSFTGGVEEVANKLGKLKFLFQETKDMSVDQSYNAIGSAINDLGANGVASEANITEFATRLGSLPDVLKPTIKEALALGAAFEESGIEAEVSSRAYNIFMKQASNESGKFAKVMGVSKKSIEDMINTNPLDFMLKFAQGMRGMDATETAKTLDFLGVNADGANKVIGAMGNNMGRFRELIDLSNNSFETGTSLVNEYNVKNNNLAATLEKIKKTVSGWFSSETFIKWLTIAGQKFAEFIGATENSEKKISSLRIVLSFTVKLLAVLIASMFSFSIANRIAAANVNSFGVATAWANLQSKLNVMWLTLQRTGLIAYSLVMSFFGKEVASTTLKIRALNIAGASSPWGAVLALITAVIGAYIAYRSTLQKTITTQETFAKQQKNLNDEVSKQNAQTKANITSLIQMIQSESISLESRKKAYQELIKINPIFNGFLKDEKFNIEGLIKVYSEYLKQLDGVTYAKKFSQLNEKNIEKEINAQQRLFNAEKNVIKLRKEWENWIESKKGKNVNDIDWSKNNAGPLREAERELKLAQENLINATKIVDNTNNFRNKKIKDLENSIKKEEVAILKITDENSTKYKVAFLKLQGDKQKLKALLGSSDVPVTTPSNFNVPGAGGSSTSSQTNPNSSQEEINRLRLENDTKYNELLLKNRRQLEDDKIAVMQEGYEKEVAIETLRYKREIEDLQRQKIHVDEMAKLDEEISKAKQAKDITKYNALIQIKKGWGDKNKVLDQQINNLIEEKNINHNQKLAIIQDKAGLQQIEKLKANYEKEKLVRETAFLNELNSLNISEQEKEKRKKDFHQKELQMEEAMLREQMILLENMINDVDFNGIDFSLLTPEQEDNLKGQIDKILNAIAKIKAEKDKLTGKSGIEISLGLGTQADILGFSQEQWTNFYKNIDSGKIGIETMAFAVFALKNAFVEVDKLIAQSEAVKLKNYEKTAESRKKSFKRQLDAGIINQDQYNKRVEKIDEDLDNKKFAIELKQAKRQKLIGAMNVLQSTAQAIMGIWAQVPKFDFGISAGILTGIVGGIGAIQLASVLKAPLPTRGAEEGYYPNLVRREQDNKLFRTTGTSKMKSGLFTKPRLLVGEGPGDMPEMVIDKKAFAQISPETKSALLREISAVKGFENGYYNKGTFNMGTSPTNSSSNNGDEVVQLIKMALAVVAKNTEVMEDIKQNGLAAFVSNKDMPSMKNIQKGMKEYNELISKSKV